MDKLYLTYVAPGGKIRAIKGLRAMFKEAGLPEQAHLTVCKELADRCMAGEKPILMEGKRELLVRCAAVLETASEGNAHASIGLPNDEDESPADFGDEPSKTALVLLAMTNGQIGMALSAANILADTTGDPELYNAVAALYRETFPSG